MSAKQIRVLVLDDEEPVRNSLTAFLEDEGLEVVGAGSGEQALAIVAAQQLDVAVVDIRLPGMNGNDFILHAHSLAPDLQFLIYTGSANYSMPDAVTEFGVHPDQVLLKPLFDMRVLTAAILRLARRGEHG